MPDEVHERMVQNICSYACGFLKYPQMQVRIMRRIKPVGKGRGYVMGHTSIGTNIITLDIYTARLRKPKKISAILAVLAHEIAHHQKPPYRQWHRPARRLGLRSHFGEGGRLGGGGGRWIIRGHFPKFYTQVNKNMAKMKGDELLGKYFT